MKVLFALAEKGYKIEGLTDGMPKEQAAEVARRMELVKRLPKFVEDMDVGDFATLVEAIESGSSLPEIKTTLQLFKFRKGKSVAVEAEETDPSGMVLLPVYGQRASAGPGQEATQLEDIEDRIPVVFEMLGGAPPRHCGIVRVVGDSMTDMGLFDGDLAIFDQSRQDGDGVFVISIGGSVRIKRLEYRPFERKLIISSENAKRYPNPEIITYEQAEALLRVHGKVIFWMHRHPY